MNRWFFKDSKAPPNTEPTTVVFSLRTSFQVPNDGFSFWEPRFRSVSKSGPGTENLDSGPLSRILATSVQVLEDVNWVIIVTYIEFPKKKNYTNYSAPPPPPFYKAHHSGVCLFVCPGSAWKLPRQTDRQTDTVALIYKIDNHTYAMVLSIARTWISNPWTL